MVRLLKFLLSLVFIAHMMVVGVGHFAPVAAKAMDGPCPHHEASISADDAASSAVASLAKDMQEDRACALKCSVVLQELAPPPVFRVELIRANWPPAAPLASRAPPAIERPPRFI